MYFVHVIGSYLEQIRTILAENLTRLRELKGLNQSEFAKAAGLNIQSYNQWENKQSWPGPDKLEILASFHGIPSSSLFLDNDNELTLKQAADLLSRHFSKS